LRRSSALFVVVFVSACSVPLHERDEHVPARGAEQTAPVPAPRVTGCAIFGGTHGNARSVALPDGRTLFVLDDGRVAVTTVADACAASANDDAGLAGASPLDLVRVGDDVWLYFRDTRGFGVARLDQATLRFAAGTTLFTADRPSYGMSAIAPLDGFVYAYGCHEAGFLRHDCFVARAPEASVADEAAYRFYTGGGQWGPRVDEAWPIVTAAASVDVVFDAPRARWLMLYAATLGSTLLVRTGLSPSGPWSAERAIASGDVDEHVFCTEPRIHSLTGEGLVASYSRVSFEPVPESSRTPVLVTLTLPSP
jgi:hypothetical protein